MKKSILCLFLTILMLLLAQAAFADAFVVKSDALSAYTDGQGKLFITGNDTAVNTKSADSLVAMDAYRIVYLSKTQLGKELVSYDLDSKQETVLAQNVSDATLTGEGMLYYIDGSNPKKLMKIDMDTGKTEEAYVSSNEDIARLYTSVNGLVLELDGNAGTLIYNSFFSSFGSYSGTVPKKSLLTNDYEVAIENGSELILKKSGANNTTQIDTGVLDFSILNDKIYYVANSGSAVRIKTYDPATLSMRVLATPSVTLDGQITATEKHLYVLGTDNKVYEVTTTDGRLTEAAAPNAKLSKDETARYTIEGMNGALNVYALVTKNNASPFTVLSFDPTASGTAAAAQTASLVTTLSLTDESNAWTTIQPQDSQSTLLFDPELAAATAVPAQSTTAPAQNSFADMQPALATLVKGNRGEAVRDIQQPLFDKGYYDYRIDGIFGWRTERAVSLLQDALGRTVDGKADPELQRIILKGDFPEYDPYKELKTGDRGMLVEAMQLRLRELGFLADSADGIFGRRTRAAVELFQKENKLDASGVATRETLKKLFDDNARMCQSYIDLYRGDSGVRVRELNRRLKELGYLEGHAGDRYGSRTQEAIRLFQSEDGLRITGTATVAVQERLFSRHAPEYSGYIELCRGDSGWRVTRLQRRLRDLGYYYGDIDGYYGRQTERAVRLFQKLAGLKTSGVATVRTQMLLFSPMAPFYSAEVGAPVISLDDYSYKTGGIYYIDENTDNGGIISIDWFANGDVGSYKVEIVDENGHKFYSDTGKFESTFVEMDRLTLDRVYHITVTAIPLNGDKKAAKTSTLSFCRTTIGEPVAEIGIPDISVFPVFNADDDNLYVGPGDLSFDWVADGDVAAYIARVKNSGGMIVAEYRTTDEFGTAPASKFTAGEIYTIEVKAIPAGGTEADATVNTLTFIYHEDPSIPTLPAVSLSVDGMTPNTNGIYDVTDADLTGLTVRWDALEGATTYCIKLHDAVGNVIVQDAVTETSWTLPDSIADTLTSFGIEVIAVPNGGTEDNGTPATVTFGTNAKTNTILFAPVIVVNNAVDNQDGTEVVNTTDVSIAWDDVEGATSYNVTVLNDVTSAVVEQDTVDATELTLDGSLYDLGSPYTISVTGIDENNAETQAYTGSAKFMIDPETVVASAPGAAVEEEVGQVNLTVSEIESEENGVCTIRGDVARFDWTCDNAAAYHYVLADSNGSEYANESGTEQTSLSINMELIPDNTQMVITITPIDANGSEYGSLSASLTFVKQTAEQPTEEPAVEEPTEQPTEEPAIEEPTEEPAIEEPTEEPAVEEPTEEPTEEPAVEEPTEEPAEEQLPVINELYVDPVVRYEDDIAVIDADNITFTWNTDLEANEFVIAIGDQSHVTASTSQNIGTSAMVPGTVYTFTVYPSGNEDGAMSLRFMRAAEQDAELEMTEPAEDATEPETLGTVNMIGVDGPADVTVGENVSISWSCDGSVSGYELTLLDGDSVLGTMQTQNTSTTLDSSKLNPGTVYTVRVTALPDDGWDAGNTAAEYSFIVNAAEEQHAEEEPYVEEQPTEEEPVVEEEPVEEEPQSYGTVNMGGIDCPADVTVGDNISISWSCDGSVSGYELTLLDGDSVLGTMQTQNTSTTLDSSKLNPGTVYTVRVTALPEDGWDAGNTTTEYSFAVNAAEEQPAEEEPVVEEEPVEEEPVEEEPVEEEPVEEEPQSYGTVNMGGIDCPADVTVGDNISISWSCDGSVSGYELTLLDGDSVLGTMQTQNTSTTLDSSKLNPGTVYTVRVTALPEDGWDAGNTTTEYSFAVNAAEEQPAEEEPYVEEQPAEEEPYVEEQPAEEEPEQTYEEPEAGTPTPMYTIKDVQDKLESLFYLTDGEYTYNTLDDVTIQAIRTFQMDNNYIPLLDENATELDDATIEWIMNYNP